MSQHSTETAQRLAETNADVWNLKKTLNGNFTRKYILRIWKIATFFVSFCIASVVELTATKNNLMDMTAAFADLEKESESRILIWDCLNILRK